MKTILTYLSVILLLSCCKAVDGPEITDSRPTTRPESGPSIFIRVPPKFYEWSDWARNRAPQLSEQLGLKEVPNIIIEYDRAPIVDVKDKEVIWAEGTYTYEDHTIRIWLLNPIGFDIEEAEFRKIFYHEYLHFYHHLIGVKDSIDHNSLFEELIDEYGWNK